MALSRLAHLFALEFPLELHLSLEKLLKALVCKVTQQPAPRIHSLPALAQRAGVVLTAEQSQFLAGFDRFNIAGR